MPELRQPIRRHPLVAPVLAGALGVLLAAAAADAEATGQAGAPPQRPPITRTDLQRHDLGTAGREAIQARIDFSPGAVAPRHRHPGEEIVYVLRGTLEYQVQGRPPVTLRVGDVLFIPAETVHAVRNVGSDSASELATYVVDKNRPLITLVP